MTIIEIIKRAIARIEQGWVQSALARDANNRQVPATSVHACKWCLLGAIWASTASGVLEPEVAVEVARTLRLRGYTNTSLASFNDTKGRSKAEVLQLLADTLIRLEAREADQLEAFVAASKLNN